MLLCHSEDDSTKWRRERRCLRGWLMSCEECLTRWKKWSVRRPSHRCPSRCPRTLGSSTIGRRRSGARSTNSSVPTTSSSSASASPTTRRTTRSTSSSHRGRRHRLPRGQGRQVWHDGETWWQSTAAGPKRDRPGRAGPRSLLRAARLHRERSALDAAVAALGPRRRPAEREDLTGLRAAGVPALEGHRPHRTAAAASQLRAMLLHQETTNPLLEVAGHRAAANRVERQGITATRRRRPGAGQRGRRRRAHRTSGRRSSTPSVCSTASRSAAAPAAARPSWPWSRPAGSPPTGQRVALVCYSHGLASYLERITAAWPRTPTARLRRRVPRPRHAVGRTRRSRRSRSAPTRRCSSGSTTCPLQMLELAAQLEPGHRFDSIVVDEAQDFADAWWDPLLAALQGSTTTGGIYVFTDEGQRVFDRHGSPPVPLVPLILDHNLRNTRQIANAFQPLVDHPMRFLGGEGPGGDVRRLRPRGRDGRRRRPGRAAPRGRLAPRRRRAADHRHPPPRTEGATSRRATPRTGTASGMPSRSSTATSSASRASSAAPSSSSSTSSKRSSAPGNASTSDFRAPATSSSSVVTPHSSQSRWAGPGPRATYLE